MADKATTIQAARSVAHRAVTEGINLRYLDQLRAQTYLLADLADDLLRERDEARAALEFYAEPVSWERRHVQGFDYWSDAMQDCGGKARAVLAPADPPAPGAE